MTDIEIAKGIELKPIEEIATEIGILSQELELYGKYKAKIDLNILKRLETKSNGKLILVTSINPTPLGEGKTTVTVGITQGFNLLGYSSIAALREPALGPVFGIKGGATGGGYSQVLPMEDINLHFTGDFHAISSACNLIASMIDNHIFHGNELNIDKDNIYFKRVVDMNDRALRDIKIISKYERITHFQITVASEIMAILCLSNSLQELKKRVGKIIIGLNTDGEYVTVKDLKVEGAVALLLKDAIKPNLVQTTENTPVIIHGGPFANIAHGCNSVLATKMALKLSDYAITEAGFGADLGAEKFFDIKCRQAQITPSLSVVVVTTKALKYHGEGNIKKGLLNLEKHIENLRKFNIPIVVAINKYENDDVLDIKEITEFCHDKSVICETIDVYRLGGYGAVKLVETIVEIIDHNDSILNEYNTDEMEENDTKTFDYIYDINLPIKEKINILCKEIYGASNVNYTEKALQKIELIESKSFGNLPICMSKTHASLSDNPKLLGKPTNYTFNIRDVNIQTGAKFIVVYSGNVIDLPGLPKVPAAVNMDIDENNNIIGLF